MRRREFHSTPNRQNKKERFGMLCPLCQNEAGRFGRTANSSQRYRCASCAKTFVNESTRAPDRRRVDPVKMNLAFRLLLEGTSIRALERQLEINRNTIMWAMVEAGEKCHKFFGKAVQNVTVNDVQADEVWGFVACKEKTRLRLNRPETVGDVWCYTALERTSKLILTYHVGKRTPDDTATFADNLYHATQGRFQLTTDGYTPYRTTIPAILGGRGISYATLVKVYGDSPDQGRYSPGVVTEVIATARLGDPDEDRICTSHVERHNKTLRMQIRRLTRLTDAHSKKWQNHEAAMALFFAYYNFCRLHGTIKMTPAKAAGLTSETWSLERLLSEASRV
jgi:transposase-like protein/IS1 family transposase